MSGNAQFVAVGDNPARAFSMGAAERASALAVKAKLDPVEAAAADRPTVYANLAYAWDPAWLAELAKSPGSVLVKDGVPVLAHLPAPMKVLLIVGPEGGVTEAELGRLTTVGAQAVRLGPTVLRSSSAGVVAASILLSRTSTWR